MMRIFIIQVRDPVIQLEVDEEQQAITRGGKMQAERTGFLAPLLVRATAHRCSSCMDLAMVPRRPETQREQHLSIKVTK